MREKLVKIDDDVSGVLDAATCEGATLKLTGDLDRKLYVKTDKVLKTLGGKWNRGKKCHIFPSDAGELIKTALARGGAVDEKKTFEAFDTPPNLAELLVVMADVQRGDWALEPSAGRGAIVQALAAAGAAKIRCIELDPKAVSLLRERFPFDAGLAEIHQGDFLDYYDLFIDGHKGWQRIVMNPPFSGGQAIQHVTEAIKCLAPSGTLVAVMPAGVQTNQDRRSKSFRDLISSYNGEFIELPEDSFRESGTRVRTVVVRIHGRAAS